MLIFTKARHLLPYRQLFNAQTRKLVTAREVIAKRDAKLKAPVQDTAPAAVEQAPEDAA